MNLENQDFVDIALGDYELFLTYQNMTLDWFKLNLEYFHLDPLADTKVLEPIAQKALQPSRHTEVAGCFHHVLEEPVGRKLA